jgi:hypothetical protein
MTRLVNQAESLEEETIATYSSRCTLKRVGCIESRIPFSGFQDFRHDAPLFLCKLYSFEA